MTERQTVAGAYSKIESHEELCAERYRNIGDTMADLKASIRWAARGVWGAAFAVLCWMALQLYNGQQARMERLEAPAESHAPAR